MAESANNTFFKSSAASKMDTDSCKVPLPNAPSSSASSYGPSQATAIHSLVTAFKSDPELNFAFEDAILVKSRQIFLRQHVLLLHDFVNNIHLDEAEQRNAFEAYRRKQISRSVAEKICNRSANATLLRTAQVTGESPSEVERFQTSIKPGTMSPNMVLEGDNSTDQRESSDESENSDPGYGRNFEGVTVLQPNKLVRLLIDSEYFPRYKHAFQSFFDQNSSPHTLRFVMRLDNVDVLRGLVDRHFDVVAKNDFKWLQELKGYGYESQETAEFLQDDMNKVPWIYFSQPTPQDAVILPEFHISDCIHQGGKKADLAPKLIPEPLENPEDTERLLAAHCGLAGVIPKSRTTTGWIGVVAFSGEKQDTASISYNVPGSRFNLIWRTCDWTS